MEDPSATDTTLPPPADISDIVDDPAIEAAASEYLGRWNRLVSTTNWEKGRIIFEWREALIDAGAPAGCYTDEAWSRHVGNITPQHSGRLRRVYQRFASVRDAYSGLYWSHYQAALDWEDAEMWLEGAVQNRWSIAQMQAARSKTLGALTEPADEEPAAELDEDAVTSPQADLSPAAAVQSVAEVHADDEVEEESIAQAPADAPFDTAGDEEDDVAQPASVRPFENLPALPGDLHDAFESFKLAIIHHRLSGWQETTAEAVLATLDALRQLVLAPAE